MRLLTFSIEERDVLGLAIDDYAVDLAGAFAVLESSSATGLPVPPKDMRSFLEAGEQAIRAASLVHGFVTDGIAKGRKEVLSVSPRIMFPMKDVRILAPILNPHKMLFLGLNYAEHANETGVETQSVPTVFAKFDNSIIGSGQPIVLPQAAPNRVDLEAELAFVVGRRAKRVSMEEAYDYIVGYTVVNDVSARDLQKRQTQWIVGKSPDTFAPIGPYLVTKDEVPDPHSLNIRSWINGRPMQDSNTSHLIFSIPFLLHHLSQTMTLEPGDLVSTGTPSGVGYVRRPPIYSHPGDVVRIQVDGVGVLENPVVAEG